MPLPTHASERLAPVPPRWGGQLALAPGIGVFTGQAGNNLPHQHWAHQLVLGLDGPAEMVSGDRVLRAPCIFVRAGVPHRLAVGRLLSVFLDPTTALSQALCQQLGTAQALCALPPPLAVLFRDTLTADLSLESVLIHLHAALQSKAARGGDARLAGITQALAQDAGLEHPHRRARLAAMAGLSETRFSHWFREHTGMPLRSYRKWLRLVRGLEHALRGGTLTDAAHQAAFADQAHFSRTFVQMFGVRASDVVSSIHWSPGAAGRLQSSPTGLSFSLAP